jgi:hypothetical protein
MQETLCALLVAATTVAIQSSSPSDWIGVWQGELDGQPSIVLTLAMDEGTLQGTLVLNGINNNGGSPHIAVHEAHVLLHPSLHGSSLSFAVKRQRGSGTTMDFSAKQTSNHSAKIHCLN